MRTGYVPTRYRHIGEPVIYSPETSMINLTLFVICYLISIQLKLVSPSIASVVGMYYMIADILINIKNIRLTNAKNAAAAELDEEDLEVDEQQVEEQPIYDSGGDEKTICDGNISQDDYEKSIDLMSVNYTDNYERSNGFDARVIDKLNAFAEHVKFKNFVNSIVDDDYSDIPDLIAPDDINSNDANILSYMNPNLRQPGQYAPSVDESLD